MSHSYIGRFAVCLASLGMLMPPSAFASNKTAKPMDVSLSRQGALTGRVIDAQGKGISGTVLVSYNGVVVARAKTSATGRFVVNGMRGGVHQLTAGGRTSVARVWSAGGAPKSANTAALLVGSTVVRSQGCGEDGCTACPTGACGGPVVMDGCGEGCVDYAPMGGGLLGGAGLFGGAGASASGLLIGGLVVGGIATAVAVAADDDDDPPASP